MNEAETRAEHIDPALKAAGWGVVEGSRVLREHAITLGRLQAGAAGAGQGRRARPEIADYVLVYRNTKLAVVEAKAWGQAHTEGVAQAKRYAAKLAVRFTYSTNGRALYGIDMATSAEGDVAGYPSPDALWAQTFAQADPATAVWRERFAAIPFEDKGGTWQGRYYQEIAIARVLEAIALGRDRILLTLATGTGKTFIAFQLAWKLFHSRWNLNDWRGGAEPSRRPRILFLADRNILADQAYNAFSAFADDALVRIDPADIRRKGPCAEERQHLLLDLPDFHERPGRCALLRRVPTGLLRLHRHRRVPPRWGQRRGHLARDPRLLQRGGAARPHGHAQAHGERRHLRLLRRAGLSVLAEGRHQRWLPHTLQGQADRHHPRRYVYTPDDEIVEGDIEAGRRYEEKDFNRLIEIQAREAYRVKIFMDAVEPREKAIVFCATQLHALAVRDLINQHKTVADPNYCVRVTANDGALGEQHLRDFQDNEKTIPTVLTTSQKLSTGVDARNVRHIVLMRPINSMIEFKQIIGRGTRLYDGKDYFTIHDFVKAHHLFSDPEWDGEPVEPEPRVLTSNGKPPPAEANEPAPAETGAEEGPPAKIKVRLADGKERQLQHMTATSFWSADGRPMSAAQFLESLFGALPEFFKDEDELRRLWSDPDTRRKLLTGLADKGFGREPLAEMQKVIEAEHSDLFDVLAYVSFAAPPVSRAERAAAAKAATGVEFTDKQRAFIDFVLAQYVAQGVDELDAEKLSPLLKLKYRNAIADAFAELGRPDQVRRVFVGFQRHLYSE
jgi:type I restriction enzyme R subunit